MAVKTKQKQQFVLRVSPKRGQSQAVCCRTPFPQWGRLASSACRRVWTSLCIRLIWITHTTVLQYINRKAPTNGVCLPLTKHAWLLWQMCESVSAHQRMCASVSMRLHGGHIFLVALLPYRRVCMHTCLGVRVCLSVCMLAYVCFCMRVRAHAHETSRGVNLFKWAGEDNERMGWGAEEVCVGGHLLRLEVHLSIPPPPLVFFTFANETICMAEKEGDKGDGGERRWDWKKRRKKRNWRWGTVRFWGRQNARRQKHTVPGRYHHFQDGCRWRRPLWDQPRDPLLSLHSGWHANTFWLQLRSSSKTRSIKFEQLSKGLTFIIWIHWRLSQMNMVVACTEILIRDI